MNRGIYIILIVSYSLSIVANNYVDSGIVSYKRGRYASAIRNWKKVLMKENSNKVLLFNFIGNAEYKLKNYAKAIAYYEKSIREDYNQPDIKFNIKVIRAKLGLNTENKTLFTNDFIRKASFFLSQNTLKIILIAIGILMLIVSVIDYFKEIPRFGLIKNYVFMLSVIFLGLYLLQSHFKSETGEAIVSIESTAFENMNLKGDSKTLKEGEMVTIEDQIGETIQVRTESDKLLWTYKSNVIKI